MRPLADLKGRWNPQGGGIEFSWDIAGLQNDRFVYIFPIERKNNILAINTKNFIIHDASDFSQGSANSVIFRIDGTQMGVTLKEFCAFSQADRNLPAESEIIKNCNSDVSYLVSCLTGRAMIEYDIRRSDNGNASLINITLNSNSAIAKGILGYQYRCGDKVYRESFPSSIQRGMTINCPVILIPSDSDFQIIPIDNRFSGNIMLTQMKKKSFIDKVLKK